MLSPGLLLAIVSGVFISFLPLISWLQGESAGRQMWMIAFGHALALPALFAVAALTGQGGASIAFLAGAVGAGLCFAINGGLYYAAAMRRGPMAVSWVIVWLSSVGVAMAGWVILREPIYAAQPIAVLCFVGCLVAMGRATLKSDRQAGADTSVKPGFWLSMIGSLIGAIVGAMLVKCRFGVGTDLMFVLGEAAGVLFGSLVMIGLARMKPVGDRRTWGCSLLWAGTVITQYLMAVRGMALVEASVFQPTMAGSGLVLGVLWAALRGHRPRPMVWFGAALALLSILFINWPRVGLFGW